jgi:hypothetical protein
VIGAAAKAVKARVIPARQSDAAESNLDLAARAAQ